MIRDVKGIVRSVAGFNKEPDEDGDHTLAVVYKLDPIPLSFLRKLFHIPLNTKDPAEIDMIYDYYIDHEQAQALQPYVREDIDLDKYIFMLTCESAE